jgi:glycosyltransferase involved in cell wall biosynthesis
MFPSPRHFWNALHEKWYERRRALFGYPFVRNANRTTEEGKQRRALFVFLSEPFIMKPSNPRFHNHQNLKQSLQMVRALGDAGFVVDVRDVNCRDPLPSAKYDLVISHRSDLVADELLEQGGRKVYLATGMNHETYNRNLLIRYGRLNSRRKCYLAPQSLNDEKMQFVRTSDAVVAYGNRLTAGSWTSITRGQVMAFNNYGTVGIDPLRRDWNSARNNFLFFAGRLQMVRGLDLLLEIFPHHPHLHLYVCSAFKHEESFCRCYDRELFHTPNIHPIGLVSKGERRFLEIVRRCGSVILPSCSDGQPGSVIEAMQTGLIPLVTRETGLDVEEAGIVVDSDSEQDIEKAVVYFSTLDYSRLEELSRVTQLLALRQYSEAAFIARWRQIAREIGSLALRER